MKLIENRDLSFDYMKGVLIFLVVWGHLISFCMSNDSDIYFDSLRKFLYSFHMPLFVFISGWFFRNDTVTGFLSIVKKQGSRLLIPQFTFVFIGFLIYLLFWNIYSYKLIENSSISIKGCYHFITFAWYLWCIFFCSLLVNLISRIFNQRAVYLLFFLCVIMWLMVNLLPGPIFNNQQVARMFPCFVAGMYARKHQHMLTRYKKMLIIICAYVSFVYWGIFVFDSTKELPNYIFRIPLQFFPMFLMYLIIQWFYAKSILKKMFLFWSKDTLFIYVFHIFVIDLLKPFHIRFTLENMWLNYVFYAFLSMIACYLLGLLGQYLRTYRISRKIFLGEKC